jgi:hypothetical protein
MSLTARTFILAIFLFSLSGVAFAEPAWKASIGIAQEFNDNVNEEHEGEHDHITSLRPALSYKREASRLTLDAVYSGDYRYYARQTNDEEFNHNLNARALLDAWNSFLFLEATDTYRLVNEDVTKGNATEDDSTSSQVQQNTFTFSPYIAPRFGERGKAKIGYAYSNIWYDDEDKDKKNIHKGFADVDYELSERASILGGYSCAREVSDNDTLDRHIAYLGGRYAYSGRGTVYLKVGPQYTRYHDEGSSATSLFWDAGLNHDFGPVQLALTSGISFDDDPDTGETYERRFGTARVTRTWDRTTASVFASLEDYEESADRGDGVESVRRTALGLNLSHEFTARLSGTAGLSHDFDDSDDNTRRWMANLGLAYELAENMNLSAWYRFKDSSSDDEDEDFRVNRVGVQITYFF